MIRATPRNRGFGRWLAPAMLVLACGSQPADPGSVAPTITVTGVVDGEAREGPFTIAIAVDRGSFTAQLNGEPFFSGRTVTQPGDYLLAVTARNGDAVATLDLRFSILLRGTTRLIVRWFDLGANESGGGGDAILLTDSSGAGSRHLLIDAGPAGAGGADRNFVARRLATLGVDTLEAMILSHAHSDHFDGMSDVLQRVVVREFFHNGQVRTFARYTQTIADAVQRAGQVTVPSAVVDRDLGLGTTHTRVSVLPPLTTFLADPGANGSEINEGSLAAEVSKGGARLFFTGDGEVAANLRWRTLFAARTRNLTILKVGHHGANDAVFDNGAGGTSAWLGHANPEVAVISANGASHPRRNAIGLLVSRPGTRTYCTSVHGDIEIRIGEAGGVLVTVERNGGADCVPGTDATS